METADISENCGSAVFEVQIGLGHKRIEMTVQPGGSWMNGAIQGIGQIKGSDGDCQLVK